MSTTPTALTGTVIGTTGSYDGKSTRDKAFDGDPTTYFDAATAGTSDAPNWVGLDLGQACSIASVTFAPRAGSEARMAGGQFQGSNDAGFASGVVVLATISATPKTGYTTLPVTDTGTYRYVRYLAPAGAYGNIAELVFTGTEQTAAAAPTLTPTPAVTPTPVAPASPSPPTTATVGSLSDADVARIAVAVRQEVDANSVVLGQILAALNKVLVKLAGSD